MDKLTAKVMRKRANEITAVGCNFMFFYKKNPTEVGLVIYFMTDFFEFVLQQEQKIKLAMLPKNWLKHPKNLRFE